MFRLVDTAIVGRLGKEQLGGVAVAIAVLSLVIAGSNFLAYGTTQRVAHRLGAGDPGGAADAGVHALWLGAIIGTCAAPVLAVLAPTWVWLLGGDGEVAEFAVTYLRISAIGVPFVVVGLAAQGVQRGASDYHSPLVILVVANIVNAVLEVVLVVGFDRGVAGAAWSTVVAQIGAGFTLWWRSRPPIAAATSRRPTWAGLVPLLSAGRHLLLRVGAMLVVFTGATSVAARVDDATLAAHSIANTMFLFFALTLDALAVPAQTLVAEELGRGGGGARHTSDRAVRLSARVGVTLAIVLAAGAPFIARLFTDEADVVSRATAALIMLTLVLIPGSVAFATDGSLIGAGDYRFLGRAAAAYLVAVIPIAVVVLVVPGTGIVGIWAGLLVWMALRAAVNHRRVTQVLGGEFTLTPSSP